MNDIGPSIVELVSPALPMKDKVKRSLFSFPISIPEAVVLLISAKDRRLVSADLTRAVSGNETESFL